jgi:1-deoxy-D-xylulose-5-phosphate reductoisomerase
MLEIAKKSLTVGGNMPAVMNGANEEAVALFLDKKIGFTQMFELVINTVENINTIPVIKEPTLDDIIASDKAAREYVRTHI